MSKQRPSDVTLPVGVKSWKNLVTLAGELPGWVFRGQREQYWRLETTLERFVARHSLQVSLAEAEHRILEQFLQRLSHTILDPPPLEDAMSWLSTIQHYGGPTRLLDLTYSLQVAAFFALEEEPLSNRSVIWAINDSFVRSILANVLVDVEGRAIPCEDALVAGDLLNSTIGGRFSGPVAAAGLPQFYTERQRLQRGLYLFGLNSEYSLEQNLYGMFGVAPNDVYPKTMVGWFTNPLGKSVLRKLRRRPVIKIFVDKEIRSALIDELATAGVSRETLFPVDDEATHGVQETLAKILDEFLEEQRKL
jgi:hypothetical protein